MRWVTLEEADPGEKPLLEEVRRAFEEGPLPGEEWKEVRARLERKVWRVERPGAAVYVKLQLFRSFRVRFRYAFRLSPTAKEARKSLEILKRGIAAPLPLLSGGEGAWFLKRRSVLVTREVRGIPAARALEEKRLALEDLARFLGVLASKGVFHPDLHLGNLLAGPGGLVLLDLQSCRLLPFRVGRKGRLAMAAKLGASLEHAGRGGDEAWARALAGAEVLEGTDLVGELRLARERTRAVERARRVKRCLMDSSGFARERWGRGRVFRRRNASRELVLREARAALGSRGGGWILEAGECPCYVDKTGTARKLWVEFRRREVKGEDLVLPLALVEERGFGGRGCLVFPKDTSPAEILAGMKEGLDLEGKAG